MIAIQKGMKEPRSLCQTRVPGSKSSFDVVRLV